MHTFINCCFSWSPKLAYRLKRLKYCGRCFPLSATSPFSNDNTAIRTCSQRLLPSYPGSGSSLGAQWQKNTTSLPNIDRISGDGATKMYSLSRVGGFRRTLAANHCRTAAEIRICWDNVSYLVETTIIVWFIYNNNKYQTYQSVAIPRIVFFVRNPEWNKNWEASCILNRDNSSAAGGWNKKYILIDDWVCLLGAIMLTSFSILSFLWFWGKLTNFLMKAKNSTANKLFACRNRMFCVLKW